MNESNVQEIRQFLLHCDVQFRPRLSERVDIEAYASKIRSKATTFELWDGGSLVGLIAAYFDRARGSCYVTNVSVSPAGVRKGVATKLLIELVRYAKRTETVSMTLEVGRSNQVARGMYEKLGFRRSGDGSEEGMMRLSVDVDAIDESKLVPR